MSMDETTNAFSALNQLIIPNISPSKINLDEQTLKMLQSANAPLFTDQQNIQLLMQYMRNNSEMVEEEKPSPSNDSESPRQTISPEMDDSMMGAQLMNGTNGAMTTKSSSRSEGWYECFTTTSKTEFDALIYSLYVIEKDERKMDGWQYFECLNRLQNKCRYKVRCKKQDEFYIVEERCGHNHGIEPVGQAGSHAGLPKTLREIVDKSFNETWSQDERNLRIDEEIRRLGLPHNPRLGRQIDNRVAYLRRVKNLNETKKIQDQIGSANIDQSSVLNAQVLQLLMEKNGGSLVVGQSIVDKLLDQNKSQMIENEIGNGMNMAMIKEEENMNVDDEGEQKSAQDAALAIQDLINQHNKFQQHVEKMNEAENQQPFEQHQHNFEQQQQQQSFEQQQTGFQPFQPQQQQ